MTHLRYDLLAGNDTPILLLCASLTCIGFERNGSLSAHVFFALSGYSPNPTDPEYQPHAAFGKTHVLGYHKVLGVLFH
ncbi:hypothetical protein TanjilG_02916 [Lupinus angustifolius]|uniref:Uncharacterized protein n=1 Tax=Lupinus angustifolius TaxID=3871 RepID=A0A1J7GMM2_LUPAN|nr:hypothetical protein TanjilG_02916 [Lupinus angustifolius]